MPFAFLLVRVNTYIMCMSYTLLRCKPSQRSRCEDLSEALLHRCLTQMRIAYDLGEGLNPSRETTLPPLVEGPTKGELLLHISGLQLADAPQLGRTLQARAPRPMVSKRPVATSGSHVARAALLPCSP